MSRDDLHFFDAAEARRNPGACRLQLARAGCCAVAAALPDDLCAKLVAHVDAELAAALRDVAEAPDAASCDSIAESHFGSVRARECRFDLKLRLDGTVREGVRALVAAVRGLLHGEVSPAGELIELACLVSDPGARRQPLHADTPCETRLSRYGPPTPCRPLLSVFVALQDVSEAMGPTLLCPGTHVQEAHELLEQVPPVELTTDAVLERHGAVAAVCSAGTIVLMDSRLLHCGGANAPVKAGGARRRIFYTTWRRPDDGSGQAAPAAPAPLSGDGEDDKLNGDWSLRSELEGAFRLADFLEGDEASGPKDVAKLPECSVCAGSPRHQLRASSRSRSRSARGSMRSTQ
eukprot:TRINITY_DN48481_c0_g1_i1.p1 TRINITY_DN48481_c0_g1~~TRINITY_DN48481_c0_g1_i1.p1  ORF type:complete len:363 (-),score=84.85 TRINITY_DN48481_c0_g1_i1:103-1146(-)